MKIKKHFVFLLCFQLFLHQFSKAQDWPNLGRYQDANEKLKSAIEVKVSVVYMGDSITDFWINNSPDFFASNNYVDRGIRGQTSPQMLVRFRADVISLKPKAVVILCGTNDIAGNTGPSTVEMIEDNITSMAELAKANKIKVVLCSVLPTSDFQRRPAEKILVLNIWLKAYADKNRVAYMDYYPAFVDDKGGMKSEYTGDGLHPNLEGYKVMESLLQPVLQKTLR